MADEQDLLAKYPFAGGTMTGPRMVAPTRRYTPPKPRPLRVTTTQARPFANLTPPKISGKKGGDDKGLIGGLLSIPGSALKAVGSGIAALPTFAGKAAQEAYGWGEFVFDNVLDAIDEDIFTSRLETDYQRGKELGLTGTDLYTYAWHRQHPLVEMIASSMIGTGGRVAELATAGKFDYGQPGIDYATAFRSGDLGATLVEDVGNVVLLGRGLGAGNVVAKAGGAIAETAPRLGRAVAATGRFIEEPIGETVRQAAGAAGRVAPGVADVMPSRLAPTETGISNFQERAQKIAAAERPVKTLFQNIGEAYKAEQAAKLGVLDQEIASLLDQQEIATQNKDFELRANIESQIDKLRDKRKRRIEGVGVIRAGRNIARRGTTMSERARQSVIQQFNRVRDYGPVPEKPTVLRKKAERIRRMATEEADPVRAQELNDAATALDRAAQLKEQFPEEVGRRLSPAEEEAAILIHLKRARVLAELERNGMGLEDLVRAATDPTVGPSLEAKGMVPTAEGVRLAIDYDNARRGLGTPLSDVQLLRLEGPLALLAEWSKQMDESAINGTGLPEGPMPFTYLQNYPVPEFLLGEIEKGGQAAQDAVAILDATVVDTLNAAVNAGILPPEIFDEWGIRPDNPTGAFKTLVAQGPGSTAYLIAFNAIKLNYRKLLEAAPNLMMNENIYPATMRQIVTVQRQALRRVTGYDVETLALELARLEEEFGNLIDENILKGIGNDIRDALNPQKRILRAVWERLNKRIETIRAAAEKRRLALESQASALSLEQQVELTKLIELEQALNAANTLLQDQASQPPAKSARLQTIDEKDAALFDERAALEPELKALTDELKAARLAEVPGAEEIRARLAETDQQVADLDGRSNEIDVELGPLLDEHKRLASEVESFLRLTESELENLPLDYADLIAAGFKESDLAPTGAVTPAELKAYKQRRIAELKKIEDDAMDYAVNTLASLGMPKGRSNAIRRIGVPDDMQPQAYTIDGLEDWREVVKSVLRDEKMYRAFLNEMTSWDPNNAPKGARTDKMTADEAAEIYVSEFKPGGERFTTEDWLTEYARTFRQAYEARQQRAKLQRRAAETFRSELANELIEANPEYEIQGFGLSGLPPSDIYTSYKYLDREVLRETRREIDAMQRRIDELQKQQQQINERRIALRRQRTEIADQLRPEVPKEASLRATQIRSRLSQIEKERAKLRRSRSWADKAERKEAIKSERARLRGTAGEVRRPEPGAEGPAVGRVRVPRQRLAEGEQARLNRADARRTQVLRRTRAAIEEQTALETAAAEAQGVPLQRPQFMPEGMAFGPELFAEGERPAYLPAGPAAKMLPGRQFDMEIRGEGAGAQVDPQFARQRTSGAFVLSLSSMAARINEVLGQQYRNMAVEEILTDPTITKRVNQLLSEEELQAIRSDAEQAVASQAVDRTPDEVKRQVAVEFGAEVMRRLKRMGYEIAAPQLFDPETGGHSPVGTLSQAVRPDQVAENSAAIRQGVAQRLFSQFEPKGARNEPTGIGRVLDGLENVTSKWKSVILPLSLRWQIGDAVGIVLFSWVRGDIPPNQLVKRIREVIGRMTDPTDPRLGAILFGDVLSMPMVDPVLAAGFGNALQARGLSTENIRFIEEQLSRVTPERGIQGSNQAMRYFNQFRTRAFRFNEAINSIGRSAVFIENLDNLLREQGRSLDEISGPNSLGNNAISDAIRQAVDATNETLGAFSDLSPWEKQVMRQIFPFWSWLRFINKAAFELAVNSPERVLLAAHLGSLATEGEDTGLADWLRGKTPVLGYFVDLNFLNPYSDAVLFNRNPFTDLLETGTSVNPTINLVATTANELYYGGTGRNLPLLSGLSRPGYLEGRPEATTRGLGDVLGGIGYKGLQTFGGPFRNVLDILPTGEVPFTDVATGPVSRFGQGSLRTTGAFSAPKLGPVAGRISPALRTLGIPAPLISQKQAEQQAKEQAQRDEAAKRRREIERRRAKS